tara:strand:- start:2647 stop:3393 length:747 start_codon:yes stop_codon:yes gene_type:complete
MKKKVGAIIEARMSSSRLYGKVLMKVNRKPLLLHLIDRIKKAKKIDKIIVATTTNPNDQKIVQFCKKNRIKFFRGSEDNVMERVMKAGKYFNIDIVVGITGDCPLLDHNLISLCLNTYLNNKADYVSNANLRSYPDGMDVQVYSINSLKKSYRMTNSKEDREHVTLHIRKNPKIFNIINIVAPNSLFYPKLGLTLDYYRDYILIKKIIEHFNKIKNTYFTCEDIINLYEKNNMFFNVNKNVKRNVIKI